MRVLILWGSKMGGTEGIGMIVADELREAGFEVTAAAVEKAPDPRAFDALLIGGALYANRWPAPLRIFVGRHLQTLRKVPVWLFSSGPLDDSAEKRDIPPAPEVSVLAERIGALGHVTFGGRIPEDASGFPAGAMAKEHAGDWRNTDQIRSWAKRIAVALPTAKPGKPKDHPAGSWLRLAAFCVAGWALLVALREAMQMLESTTLAHLLVSLAAPIAFVGLGALYFRPVGTRGPGVVALLQLGTLVLLDIAVLSVGLGRGFGLFASIGGLWVPYVLSGLALWGTGSMMAISPWELIEQDRKAKAAAES